MKSYQATKEQAFSSRNWLLADAKDQIVGRLATKVAHVLRGKHKPTFTPHNDGGDFVVVVNADKLVFSGNKALNKSYYKHSGYIGGISETKAGELLANKPEELFRNAVRRMLPKNNLGRAQLSKLKIYTGPQHPHEAQQLTSIEEVS
jgi:large subunit ribosomal protein L13